MKTVRFGPAITLLRGLVCGLCLLFLPGCFTCSWARFGDGETNMDHYGESFKEGYLSPEETLIVVYEKGDKLLLAQFSKEECRDCALAPNRAVDERIVNHPEHWLSLKGFTTTVHPNRWWSFRNVHVEKYELQAWLATKAWRKCDEQFTQDICEGSDRVPYACYRFGEKQFLVRACLARKTPAGWAARYGLFPVWMCLDAVTLPVQVPLWIRLGWWPLDWGHGPFYWGG